MMNTIKLSICISVHNTAEYLPRCLDSILCQSYKDYEIILVNNGSTDNSPDIMYQYKASYPNVPIIIVEQEDRGLSQGRQTGIANAKGTYVTFIDADDYYLGESMLIIMGYADHSSADIIEMQSEKDGQIISSGYSGMHNSKCILHEYFKYSKIPTMLWLRTYKKSLFQTDVLPKMYVNNEDSFAFPCLLYRAETIGYIEEVLHHYSTDNENAIMHGAIINPDTYNLRLKSLEKSLYIPKHLCDVIGCQILKHEFEPEYDHFVKRTIMNYLLLFPNATYRTDYRLDKCVEIIGFENRIACGRFLKSIKFKSKQDLLLRLFGVHFTCWVWRLLK